MTKKTKAKKLSSPTQALKNVYSSKSKTMKPCTDRAGLHTLAHDGLLTIAKSLPMLTVAEATPSWSDFDPVLFERFRLTDSFAPARSTVFAKNPVSVHGAHRISSGFDGKSEEGQAGIRALIPTLHCLVLLRSCYVCTVNRLLPNPST